MQDELRSLFNRAISAVLRDSGGDFTLDSEGMVTIAFAGGLAVTVEVPETGRSVFLYVPLDRVAEPTAGSTMRAALDYNLFRSPLPNAWIGLDRDTEKLMLCALIKAEDCEPDTLGRLLAEIMAEAAVLDGGSLDDGRRVNAIELPADLMIIRS